MSDEETLSALARTDDLASLEVFNTYRMGKVASLAPLTKAKRLRRFVVGEGRVPDLTPLCELPSLEEISIDGATVESFAPLRSMRALERLAIGKSYRDLAGLGLSLDTLFLVSPVTKDLDCLEGFRVRVLRIGSQSTPSAVDEKSALPALAGLEELHLRSRAMTQPTSLAGLTSLSVLDLGSNKKLRSLEGLQALERLEVLVCHSTSVADLAPLSQLPLRAASFEASTKIKTAAPLFGCASLRRLDLRRTGVARLDGVGALRELELLYLAKTKVADLSPLAGLPLRALSAAETRVSDFAVLAELPALEYLNVGTTGLDDPTPIAAHPTLREVVIRGTPLEKDAAAVREIEAAGKTILGFQREAHPTQIAEWPLRADPHLDPGGA